MAWQKDGAGESIRGNGRNVLLLKETLSLPASGTGYSSAIDHVGPDRNQNRFVTFTVDPSAVAGMNIDIALYGADSLTGDKYLLKDAVVADLTATGKVAGVVDLNAFPAPFYFVGWTVDADNSANTIDVSVSAAI